MSEYPGENPSSSPDADPEHTAPITPQSQEPAAPPPPQQPPVTPPAESGPVWNPSSAQYGAPSGQGTPPPPSPPYAPPSYGAPSAYGAGAAAQVPGYAPYGAFQPPAPAHPRATTSMVLGIIGLASLVICGIGLVVSPFAWAFGQSALREIRESGGRLGGEGQANAGRIMGIIGTVLLVLAIVGLVLLIIGFATSTSSSDFSTDA